jgi:hypothetical protein
MLIVMTAALSGGIAVSAAQDAAWITYRLENPAEVFRIEASTGATPENVSDALDTLTPRADDLWLNTSPDGSWFLLETERWGCSGWACLARAKADVSEGGLVTIGGNVIHPEGFSAISSDGNRVVWVGESCGVHSHDLWTSTLSTGVWSTAACLTASSSGDWNEEPAISPDGTEILFSCGENICSVSTQGTNLQLEISLTDYPGTGDWTQIKAPDYDPDGNIVFEGEAGGEMVWRKNTGTGVFEIINSGFTNDNSPCVLPDGRVASLWLNRPENPTGVHELKVMDPDGGNQLMLVTYPTDIFDVGLGCGGTVGHLFSDDFESATTGAWSSAFP